MQSPSSDENRADLLGFQDPEAQEAHASLGVTSWKETEYQAELSSICETSEQGGTPALG